MAETGLAGRGPVGIARVDLHCHTRASFDSAADPAEVVARAARRGITHLAITDHDTLDGAAEAAEAAAAGSTDLTVIAGCEVTTIEGDLIFLFVETPVPTGLPAREAIRAGREQGALVGIPHPFDSSRRSLLLDREHEALVELVDWLEGVNGRVAADGDNRRATRLAQRLGLPAVGVSDAHTLLEIGLVSTIAAGDPSTAAGLKTWLRQSRRIHVAPGTSA